MTNRCCFAGDRRLATVLQEDFVHVAPPPILSRLEGTHDGMLGIVKVLRSMPVLGRIATPDVTALQAKPQVHPLVSHLEAFLAAFATRFHVADF